MLKAHPHLVEVRNSRDSTERIEKAFECSLVSRRLVMFHVWFLRNVAQAAHSHLTEAGCKTCCQAKCCLPRYERTKGLPTRSMANSLQQATKRLLRDGQTWTNFFD